KKARYEDALHATRAAIESGIVPGGGVVFIRAQKALDSVEAVGDEKIGVEILRKAMEYPARQIAINAGKDGAVTVARIKEGKDNFGYDADRNEFCDLVKAGIIDPAKVSKCALENGASVASLLLTTECLVAKVPEKKKPAPGGHHEHDYDEDY
ncbi:MAG: chaperonin GroEL, partial [Planctomycetota bacterium]|nr:chaperonin GroEL [Planctomycetota bacterium]